MQACQMFGHFDVLWKRITLKTIFPVKYDRRTVIMCFVLVVVVF